MRMALYCPYCKNKSQAIKFLTPSQIEYIKSQVKYTVQNTLITHDVRKDYDIRQAKETYKKQSEF